MRIAITGGTGLIGTVLAARLVADGSELVRLVRREPVSAAEVRWDPKAAGGGIDPAALTGLDAVVHLSGASLASGRWTVARKRELWSSRVDSTAALVRAMAAAPSPPRALLSASAIGWYGDTGDAEVDDSAPAGTGFLAELVAAWEGAAAPATLAGIRTVLLRSGVVLASGGGMLRSLLPPFRLGLGTTLGSGRQYLSWISLTDHVRAVRFLLEHAELAGPVNLTGPAPVTNAVLTAELASALHRKALLRAPGPLLRAALGEMSAELLGSARVLPARLGEAGFSFTHPDIGTALAAELAALAGSQPAPR
jgi:uncharacterized protein (TIGR01777 family)